MPVEFAPNFRKRHAAQRAFEQTCIQQGKESARWILVDGDYSLNQIVYGHSPTDFFRGPRFHIMRLSGYEIFLRDQMQAAIDQKGDSPAVFLDLGGGAGESWAKLALYFRREVTRGEAIFMVSNLVFKPEQYYQHFHRDQRVNQNVIDARNNGLIQYIEGPFSDLPTRELALPNGTTISLNGHTTLINEDKSLTNWTQIPEVDIPIAGGLLSPYGIYMVRSDDVLVASTYSDDKNRRNITKGKEIAYRILATDYNLTTVTTAEAGKMAGSRLEYFANKKPLAPEIIVN